LGLATVQRIIARLGGKVGVKANEQGGNEFFFELTMAPGSR
jgi:C4-dicarboxylate-specific signal transduction histidine kinase